LVVDCCHGCPGHPGQPSVAVPFHASFTAFFCLFCILCPLLFLHLAFSSTPPYCCTTLTLNFLLPRWFGVGAWLTSTAIAFRPPPIPFDWRRRSALSRLPALPALLSFSSAAVAMFRILSAVDCWQRRLRTLTVASAFRLLFYCTVRRVCAGVCWFADAGRFYAYYASAAKPARDCVWTR